MIAAALLGAVVVTGAVASRFWTDWIAATSFRDPDGRLWHLSGNFKGRTEVLDPDGKVTREWLTDEGDPRGTRAVVVEGERHEFRGHGKHPVRSPAGELLGFVRLAESTAADDERLEKTRWWSAFHWETLYRGDDPDTAADVPIGTSNPLALPGLVAGHREEARVSWVVRGYARVTATYPAVGGKAQTAAAAGAESLDPENAPPRYRQHLERMLSVVPRPGAEPEIRWALVGEPAEITLGLPGGAEAASFKAGRWTHVRERGRARGYGRHEVKDEKGKTVLVLDVEPLK